MNPPDSKEIFPRQLTDLEKEWLYSALPADKIGYKIYRDKIAKLSVVGYGRFGKGNYILGKSGSVIDLSVSSAPIFAVAEIIYDKLKVYISINEELDDQIEIDIRKSSEENLDNLRLTSKWSYSDWSPGKKAPNDNAEVREIHLVRDSIVLAIAPEHKKLWIHNTDDMVNRFIPVSNYYNEVMKIMNIREPKTALNPNRIFTNLDEFTDEDLGQGFLLYNKYWKRIELDYTLFKKEQNNKTNKSFLRFFKS